MPPKFSMETGTDTRVVYGANCMWWDSISKVATTRNGLPCCPFCGGVLFEVDNEGTFLIGAAQHEAAGNPGYVQFVKWLRGKCYPSMDTAQEAYRSVQ